MLIRRENGVIQIVKLSVLMATNVLNVHIILTWMKMDAAIQSAIFVKHGTTVPDIAHHASKDMVSQSMVFVVVLL